MTTDSLAFDPKRRLCPDGACVGVVGADGRCRACGRSADGGGAAPAAGTPGAGAPDAAGGLDAGTDGAGDTKDRADAFADPEAAAFAAGRKLCPDGTCLGIVGADGRCNVCGAKE